MTQDTKTQSLPAETPEDEPLLGERHPLAPAIGVFKDNPMFDAVMEEVYKNRRRMEAEATVDEQDDLAA